MDVIVIYIHGNVLYEHSNTVGYIGLDIVSSK